MDPCAKVFEGTRGWQLEQVGLPAKVTGCLPLNMVACHINLLVACTMVKLSDFPGEWHGELPIHQHQEGHGCPCSQQQRSSLLSNKVHVAPGGYWLVCNRQRVMLHKGAYLKETYGLADPDATFPQLVSYKQYCRQVLDKRCWGHAVILYAISCLWALKIMVVNSQMLQEYRVRHGASMKDADIGLVFNGSSHYTAAGE